MKHSTRLFKCLAVAAILAAGAMRASAERALVIPAPAHDEAASPTASSETIVLAGGCFWGVQGVFQHVKGVSGAVSGYAGGTRFEASYDRVSTGTTGHAESVQVTFDPREVSLGRILQVYFSVAHDPTQLNRQGPDRGTQYRSEIFAQTPAQKALAEAYIAQLDAAKVYGAPIVTRVETGKAFFAAESYHQDYLIRNPYNPYIMINDRPKIANLKQLFPNLYRPEPIRVADAR